MIELSVTIVTYKTDYNLLIGAIQSIIDENSLSYIVVADNDSGENYFNNLKLSLQHMNIDVISTHKNGGYGFGHNYAEKFCPDSKFHLIMNADIVVHKGSLKKMINYMKKESDIALLSPKILNPNGSIQYLNKRAPTVLDLFLRRILTKPLKNVRFFKRRLHHYEKRDIGYDHSYDLPLISGCFMLIVRKVFKNIKGFDESYFMYFEDFDLCKRIGVQGYRISYLSNSMVTHYWERGSAKNLKLFVSLVRSAIIYFNRWGWKLW